MKRATILLLAALIVLAVGAPALRAGGDQAAVTDRNLNQMIAKAKTPADHEAIATYYDREAAENENKVKLHRASENIYTKGANQVHCNALVKDYQRAAEEDRALAARHHRMARELKAKSHQ